MKILQSEYSISVNEAKPSGNVSVPEIAIAGRSNVGKSSFINMLTARKKLARASAEPGRTRMINYFSVNQGLFYLVDLPGYGFAKVSDSEKKKWANIMEYYLKFSPCLKLVIMLVDIRHEASELDKQMLRYIEYNNINRVVVATKVDKLSKAALAKAVSNLSASLMLRCEDIILTSSLTGTGRDLILDIIEKYVKQ